MKQVLLTALFLTLMVSQASAIKCEAVHSQSIDVIAPLSQSIESSIDLFKVRLRQIATGVLKYLKPNVGYKRIHDLQTYAEAAYGEVLGKSIYEKLYQVGHESLIVDAGIAMRVDEFISYVKTQSARNVDSWSMRESFSKKLGTVVVYRTMGLTEAELNVVKKVGMRSGSLRNSDRIDFTIEAIQHQIKYHAAGFTRSSNLISVTSYQGLAIAVGKASIYKTDKILYLFTLEVPILDLLNYEGIFGETSVGNLALRLNFSKLKIDSNLESLAIVAIAPDKIKKVTKVGTLRQWLNNYEHIGADESVFISLVNSFKALFD